MKSARVAASTRMPELSKSTWWPSLRPEPANRSISARVQASARSTRFGPITAAAAAMIVFGELPAARAASAATSTGSPTRLTSAATAMSSIARSFGPALSCTSGSAKLACSGCSARSSTECPCTEVTCVFGSITDAPDLSFMFWRAITAPTCALTVAICSA